MPARDQFFADLAAETRQVALLVAQVGAAPTELQLITQIADYDENAGGLRPVRSYIIRALGVLEHRIVNFGMTVADVALVAEHPLLDQYITTPTAVFFRGKATNIDSLVLDIAQAHATTFGPWRQFPEYLNTQQPLHDLFAAEGGLVGQMPKPLAARILDVLAYHGLETRTAEGEPHSRPNSDASAQSQQPHVLTLGASYFVAYAFSFEMMRGRSTT